MTVWYDNNSSIYIDHNDDFHKCTKHIEIDCHFVNHHVLGKTVRPLPISTTGDQYAYIYTKEHLPSCLEFLFSKHKLDHTLPTLVWEVVCVLECTWSVFIHGYFCIYPYLLIVYVFSISD